MRYRYSHIFLGILTGLLILGAAGLAWCYSGPDDPAAVKAAREAVKRLGPTRGALALSGEVLDIKGFRHETIARNTGKIKGVSAEVENILNDLGAKTTQKEIRVSLSGDVLFDFDKWEIKKAAEKTLYKLVKAINGLNVKEVLIEGYTDSKGSESYNLTLSKRRAEAVRAWLIEKGKLKDLKIITKGYGEAHPVAPNTNPDGSDNPTGRALNRRVEIYITLQGE